MTKNYFAVALVLLLGVSAAAQNSSKRGGVKKTSAKVELSSLYNTNDPGQCLELPQSIIGTIVSRKFDDDEVTLIGFTIREKNDERSFVNIDAEYVAGKGRFIPSQLSSILGKGKRVKIRLYGCGAAGLTFFLDRVTAL
ncbi:MAG TPA: hypothetical protein VF527_18300 [Pyrinomonadaceae bacterium]